MYIASLWDCKQSYTLAVSLLCILDVIPAVTVTVPGPATTLTFPSESTVAMESGLTSYPYTFPPPDTWSIVIGQLKLNC